MKVNPATRVRKSKHTESTIFVAALGVWRVTHELRVSLMWTLPFLQLLYSVQKNLNVKIASNSRCERTNYLSPYRDVTLGSGAWLLRARSQHFPCRAWCRIFRPRAHSLSVCVVYINAQMHAAPMGISCNSFPTLQQFDVASLYKCIENLQEEMSARCLQIYSHSPRQQTVGRYP